MNQSHEFRKLRKDAGWAIRAQCLNKVGLKSGFHIDHIDDGTFYQYLPQKMRQRSTLILRPAALIENIFVLKKK